MKRGTPDLWIDRCPTCGTERYFSPATEGERHCMSCPGLWLDEDPAAKSDGEEATDG